MRKIWEGISMTLAEKWGANGRSTRIQTQISLEVESNPCVELFLSKLEEELFPFLPGKPQIYNLFKKQWEAMRTHAEGRSIILKHSPMHICKKSQKLQHKLFSPNLIIICLNTKPNPAKTRPREPWFLRPNPGTHLDPKSNYSQRGI